MHRTMMKDTCGEGESEGSQASSQIEGQQPEVKHTKNVCKYSNDHNDYMLDMIPLYWTYVPQIDGLLKILQLCYGTFNKTSHHQ